MESQLTSSCAAMDCSKKSNASASHSTQEPSPTVSEDEHYNVVAAKKLKMASSTDDLKSRGRTVDLAEIRDVNGGSLNSNSSQSPEQFVFSIDHILESILQNVDRRNLLNCRLVSRRWAYYGSKALQNSVSIGFVKHSSHRKGPRVFRFTSDENRSLRHLINLMNKSTQFPCTSFEFRATKQEKSKMHSAQPFFNAHGALIKKITFHEYLSFEDLKFLLLNQATHLQELYLGQIRLTYDYTNQFTSELEHGRSLYDEYASNPKPILKNLKTFQCHFSLKLPPRFMQQILDCSPNLVNVALPKDGLQFLVQPTNRLHLLQTLTIDIDSSNIESHELVAHHLQGYPNVAVRELTYCNAHKDDESVTNIMRNYLRACSATVQKLVWSKGVSNLQFPKMPRVKDLTIQCHMNGEPRSLVTSLGNGVCLGDTFPNLKFLELTSNVVLDDISISSIFNDDDPIPAANLKRVTLKLLLRPGQKVLQSFREMFPNASILNKSEVRSAYYGEDDDDVDDDDDYGEEEDYEEEYYSHRYRYRYYDFEEEEDEELCEEEDENEELCVEEDDDDENNSSDDIEDEGNKGDDGPGVPLPSC